MDKGANQTLHTHTKGIQWSMPCEMMLNIITTREMLMKNTGSYHYILTSKVKIRKTVSV